MTEQKTNIVIIVLVIVVMIVGSALIYHRYRVFQNQTAKERIISSK